MPTIPHADYRVTIPDEWRDASIVMFAGPGNDGFGPMVTIGREKLEEPESKERYAERLLPLLKKTFEEHGFELVEETATNLNGMPAIRRRYDCSLKANPITQVQYYIVNELTAYVVTMSDRKSRFSKSSPTMRVIAETFALE